MKRTECAEISFGVMEGIVAGLTGLPQLTAVTQSYAFVDLNSPPGIMSRHPRLLSPLNDLPVFLVNQPLIELKPFPEHRLLFIPAEIGHHRDEKMLVFLLDMPGIELHQSLHAPEDIVLGL
jgi:hypothetical protein